MATVIENISRLGRSVSAEGKVSGATYLIGDLSRTIGLEPTAIRFYESEGLVSPRRVGHMRIYSEADAERLLLVKEFRKFGLSLNKSKAILCAIAQTDALADGNVVVTKILEDRLKEMVISHVELGESILLVTNLLKTSDMDGIGLAAV